MAEKKKRIRLTDDQWREIEGMYRANQLTIKKIADKYGVTPNAITMKAQRSGWERNLGKRVRDAVIERVREQMPGVDQNDQAFQDQCLVEEASDLGLVMVREHQSMFNDFKDLIKEFVMTLRSQRQKLDPKDFSQALNNAVSALEKLVRMDRQAINLDSKQETNDEADNKVDHLFDYLHDNGSMDETVVDYVEVKNNG